MAATIGDHISTARAYAIPFAGYTIMGMYALYVSQLPLLPSPCQRYFRGRLGTDSEFFYLIVAWSSPKHGKVASGSVVSTSLRTCGSTTGPLGTGRRQIPTSTRREAKSSSRGSSHSRNIVRPRCRIGAFLYLNHSVHFFIRLYILVS